MPWTLSPTGWRRRFRVACASAMAERGRSARAAAAAVGSGRVRAVVALRSDRGAATGDGRGVAGRGAQRAHEPVARGGRGRGQDGGGGRGVAGGGGQRPSGRHHGPHGGTGGATLSGGLAPAVGWGGGGVGG